MLQDTAWKFSNEEPVDEYAQPEAGLQYLQIKKAEVSDDELHYTLGFISLTNNAYINIRYFLYATDQETGELIPDAKQRRTLISLKKALYGPESNGIPNPADIVGCVVMADVKMVPAKNNPEKAYPRIYGYKAVPGEVAATWGNPEQYALPNIVGENVDQEIVDE